MLQTLVLHVEGLRIGGVIKDGLRIGAALLGLRIG